MSLRSIPLRYKLVTALVIPMLVVAGYLTVSIADSIERREVAESQRDEIARFEAVADFADKIGLENLVLNDRNASDEYLALARSSTDSSFERLRAGDVDLPRDTLDRLEARYAELLALRSELGTSVTEIRLRSNIEIRSGEGDQGPYGRALSRLAALPPAVLADFEFDDDAVADVRTAGLVDDYFLVQSARADVRREASTVLRVAALPGNLIDAEIVELVGSTIAQTDQSFELLEQLGSDRLTLGAEALLISEEYLNYSALRQAVDAAGVGVKPDVDGSQIQAGANRFDAAVAELGTAAIDELDARADNSVSVATRDLVVAALIGIWLLILVGLLLRVLYRAIKSPLERLTARSQQIADVELPDVVERMRRGEIDEIPEIEPIPAESKDEIGELVHAFNGMHKTAVELAAEQAASRRVVADMFVNLGRRNQRLVGRLLKGLTVLEQHEEDADKLASLYEIDHVATRMRRNAESLLVLAGAGQARRWDQPVSMYDIARASLAEVENYERVQIDTGEDERISGDLVADLTHLLAELIENALSFSPPTSPVEVVARMTKHGYVIAVSDHGVGMSSDVLEAANRRISQAADQDETPSEFLGHYVVGRLAARHRIRVDLLEGPAGGIIARIVIPGSYVSSPASGDELNEDMSIAAPIEPLGSIGSSHIIDDAEPAASDALEEATPTPTSSASDDSGLASSIAEQGRRTPRTTPAASIGEQAPRRLRRAPEQPAVDAEPDPTPLVAAPPATPSPAASPLEVGESVPAASGDEMSLAEVRESASSATADEVSLAEVRESASAVPGDEVSLGESAPVTSGDEASPDGVREPALAAPGDEVSSDGSRESALAAPSDESTPFDYPSPTEVDPIGAQPRRGSPSPATPVASSGPAAAPAATPQSDEPFDAPAASVPAPERIDRALAPLSGTAPADTALPSTPPTPLSPSTEATEALNRAADEAVNGALTVFGASRRNPGANLPATNLLASISGSMGSLASQIDGTDSADSGGSAAPTTTPPPSATDVGDPDAVRSNLSGFQQGINRADRETSEGAS